MHNGCSQKKGYFCLLVKKVGRQDKIVFQVVGEKLKMKMLQFS